MDPDGETAFEGRQKGLSLVELMIALAVGAVVALAASTYFLNTTSAGANLSQRSQRAEQLRAVMDTLRADLRRVGRLTGAPPYSYAQLPAGEAATGFALGQYAASGTDRDCITYRIDDRRFGYRRVERDGQGVIQAMTQTLPLGGGNAEVSCDEALGTANSRWMNVTDPQYLVIEAFNVNASYQCFYAESDDPSWLSVYGNLIHANPCSMPFTVGGTTYQCGIDLSCREQRQIGAAACGRPADVNGCGAAPGIADINLTMFATVRNDLRYQAP